MPPERRCFDSVSRPLAKSYLSKSFQDSWAFADHLVPQGWHSWLCKVDTYDLAQVQGATRVGETSTRTSYFLLRCFNGVCKTHFSGWQHLRPCSTLFADMLLGVHGVPKSSVRIKLMDFPLCWVFKKPITSVQTMPLVIGSIPTLKPSGLSIAFFDPNS